MIEILSLPRRNNIDVVQFARNVRFNSGLPINSLPGWENIPLNSKLPMLKCPDNQVIFSKNKIGQSVSATVRQKKLSTKERILFFFYLNLNNYS